ncbi:MAG: AmmeMemoRadiSam system radical SAM enzyme [Lentisphaerae bacterium GWF2_44_16]|nr:MAG: AmmeMemoRadiSam system radical SAM enzyme [Lentisphaerae bacterium GWF2_44_16]
MPSASAQDGGKAVRSRKAMYYTQLPGKRVKCLLCPRGVSLANGQSCYCRTRRNIDGNLYAIGYRKPCIVNFEPVERAPLYHFHPGTETMSLGAAGCNMTCLYCQNYELAQSSPENTRNLDVNEENALRKGPASSLTLTYTDAACQPEYLLYLSEIAEKLKFPLILCTGAYINSLPLQDIIPHTDAFAITLKAATDEMYMKLTGVHLKPVLNSIKQVAGSGKWIEITTLIVPDYNDDAAGIQYIAKWIRDNAGENVPWHLSRFTPNYRLDKLPPTPRRTLEEAREIGLNAGLKYVYITNLAPHDGNNTYCPSCHKKIIERLGFKTRKNYIISGKCPFCRTVIPGKWT